MVNEFILTIIGALTCLGTFIALERLHRKERVSPELLRRGAHIVSSLIASIFSLLLSKPFFLTALISFFLLIVISRRKKIFNHIHKVSRPTIGEELLPLGFIASYLIANGQPNIYIPAFLIVGCADPLTGIIMERYDKHYLGIVVFLAISVFILLLFKIPLLYILIVAMITAFIERISGYGTDNLTIPVTVAILLFFLK